MSLLKGEGGPIIWIMSSFSVTIFLKREGVKGAGENSTKIAVFSSRNLSNMTKQLLLDLFLQEVTTVAFI